ncbi:MAG: DUF4837 family protein [Tangfeifania sp.]
MRLKIINRIILLITFAAFASCDDGGTAMHKNITGKAGEVVVVMSNEAWDSEPGEVVRQTLAQEHLALPQDEPLFDLVKVPGEGFKSIFKSTRNILQARISPNVDSARVAFLDDAWAYPQATVTIEAKTPGEFVEIFNEHKNRIMSYFVRAERERLSMNYDKYYEREIYNVLNEDFGITMKVSPGFQIAEQKEDFIWLRFETPKISQGIVIYTFPYVSDSAFTQDYLMKVRDSVLRANVPGPAEGSYMATERRVDQVFNIREHNGNYASEMRGLWRLKNDFMGGPYVSLAVLDVENQRVIVGYGYVYAPNTDKRNYLRQVEAMLYSMELANQDQNDDINMEVEVRPES